MKVLLTGATGFVGSHLAKDLVDSNHEVYALVRSKKKSQFLKKLGVHLIFSSLEELQNNQVSFPNLDGVIHNAGLIKTRKKEEYYRVNVEGTRQLLKALSNQKLKRFVFVSSIAARGPNRSENDNQGRGAVSHYGKSKLQAEKLIYASQSKWPVTIIRPPVVYGPGDPATLTFFKMFKRGLFTVARGGNEKSSFVYVKDLSKALVASVESKNGSVGPYYPEDGSGGYYWDEVISMASKVYQKRIRKILLPLWAIHGAAAVTDCASRIFRFTPMLSLEKFQEMKQTFWTCSSYELNQTYQLPPVTDLQTGFSQTKEWYEKEGWL